MEKSRIVLGRKKDDFHRYGTEASIFYGKKLGYGTPIFFDVAKPHVVLISGKRGSGKSYSQSNILEGMAELKDSIRKEIATIMFDTMGIFWSLKYKNTDKDELKLLKEWDIKPKAIKNIDIYVPLDVKGKDKKFSIRPSELSPEDWCLTFKIKQNKPQGICLIRSLKKLRKMSNSYSIDDIINTIKADKLADTRTIESLHNRLESTKDWGIFSSSGFKVEELIQKGKISIIDISKLDQTSAYWNIRSLVVGLISRKILRSKMKVRQKELKASYKNEEIEDSNIASQVWLFMDEAHQFLPSRGKTPASFPLKRTIREGRQPGVSMVMATQQPGKIDSDVLTQSDIVICHHITSKIDIDGLNKIMNTYLKKNIKTSLNELPKKPGVALVIDDTREKIEKIKVRPKKTMHAGESPNILKEIYETK